MWRGAASWALVFAASARGQQPVDRWLEGAPRADIRWSVNTDPAVLSSFQRLRARWTIRIHGDELVRRRGRGRLLTILELRDRRGVRYETHHLLDLREPPYASAQNVESAEWIANAFLLPGDYEVTFAMADITTGEHSLARKKLHVAPLSSDPLSDAWRDLPAVEFAESNDPPESWYLPEMASRLALPLETKRRVTVEIVANAAVSEMSRAAQRRTDQTMALLLPALKVLSQIDVRNGSLHLALLDVERRRTLFAQESAAGIDWNRLKPALTADDLHTIDARALKNRARNVQFFVRQIARRIAPDENRTLRVVIVLSAPMSFPSGTDRTPAEPPEGSDYRVFYIRYQTIAGRPAPVPDFFSSGRRPAPPPLEPTRVPSGGLPDQLEDTLKALHPRAFEVWTPLDFRKALAAILREISKN